MKFLSDAVGTFLNSFRVGNGQSGYQSLILHNGFANALRANTTAKQTWDLPDRSGTLATVDQISSSNASVLPTMKARQSLYMYNDFLLGMGQFTTMVNGSGAGANSQDADNVDYGGHPGVCVLKTGQTNTGYGCIGMGNSVGTIQPTYGEWYLETSVYFPLISTTTETFIFQFGFNDVTNNFTSRGIDTAHFRYTNGENGGRWQLCVTYNNTATTIDSGITVNQTTWYTLRVYLNANSTVAKFFINGNQIGGDVTITPFGAGRVTNIFAGMAKSVGTTNRFAFLDYIEALCLLTTPR